MEFSIKANRNKLLIGLASMVLATNAVAPKLYAQDASSSAPASSESAQSDQELVTRVKTALHSAPYLYDKHINVSVRNGQIILRGFVMSSEEKDNALRIARKAADGHTVIDALSIKHGGRR